MTRTIRLRPRHVLARVTTALVLAAASAACEQPTVTAQGCDGVDQIVTANCVSCHSGGSPSGNLDMQTDWYAAWQAKKLVVPHDAADSIIYRRITNHDHPMPPTGLMSDGNIAIVHDWIESGASCPASGT